MAGIYLHIPFCHAKCAYCDFYSIGQRKHSAEYVDAVIEEYRRRRCELGEEPVTTLYFGGGTPSILSEQEISTLASELSTPEVEEFTIEVNPEDVTPQKVNAWLKAGVNRVSMGVQSLVDKELNAVNRRHSATEALAAIDLLQKSGIKNISCDLIYGLPGQTLDSWKFSLENLLNKGIQHLSAYNLTIEEGTLLALRLKKGLIEEASDELVEQMYAALCTATRDAGFNHYEISNFAIPGYESRHNSSYWDGTPYLGLGPGAHSLDINGVRRFIEPDVKRYIAYAPSLLHVDAEDDIDRINDRIFTALRTSAGIASNEIPKESIAVVKSFLNKGLLVRAGEGIRIPEEHFLISDSIIREIFV